jgi:S1-C subfamily serine protease
MLRHIKYMTELAAKMLMGFLLIAFAVTVHFDLVHKHENEKAFDYLEVVKESVVDHVVRIDIMLGSYKYSGGTGFHMEHAGKIVLVTNNHVCDPVNEGMTLRTLDQGTLEVIKISKEHDLCLLKSNRLVGLKLAHTPAQVLDRVILVGHPRGLSLTIREGHVMEVSHAVFPWMGTQQLPYAELSTITYGGSSGSPVVNTHGMVVGVLFAGYRDYNTEGMMVPWLDLLVFLDANIGE